MATITVNGDDVTKQVVWDSLRIENIITSQVDSCRFSVRKPVTRSFVPRTGQEVIITESGTKIFAGIITAIKNSPLGKVSIKYDIECVDYTRLLDRREVVGTFIKKTVNEIISELNTNFFSAEGITINNVDCPINVDRILFDYVSGKKAISKLAELTGYDWYIDYDKDLHFFAKEDNLAPFNLSDTSNNYNFNSLIIRSDNSQLRNSVLVKGGEYLAGTITVEQEADGEKYIFDVPYKFSDVAVTLSGEVRTTGRDYLDLPDDFDCLHNFGEKLIRFKEADKPSSGAVLKVAGNPYIPVLVKVRDADSIASMVSLEGGSGLYEYKIVDRDIKSRESAKERAKADLEAYKLTISEGDFDTETSGLSAGQQITVQSNLRNIDEDFIISKVVITALTPEVLHYSITLVTTRTIGMIEVLQKLLSDQRIERGENDVIDRIEPADENIGMSEVNTLQEAVENDESTDMNEVNTVTVYEPPFAWAAAGGTAYNSATPHKARWNLSSWWFSIKFGEEDIFNAASTLYNSVAKLDDTHIVVAFRDSGDSSKGKAIIGTIDGDSITYGSEYEFNAASSVYISVARLDDTHFVVAFSDSDESDEGIAMIGTVSGTTITFGSEYEFNAADTEYISVAMLDSTHFVVGFQDEGGDDYGIAMIGVVSNEDEITFGSEYIFNSADTRSISVATLDSSHFVIAYSDIDSGYGNAIIGTVSSGDNIAYGSEYQLNDAGAYKNQVDVIDSTHFVVVFQDAGSTNDGTAIIGVVSNENEIAYGSKHVFDTVANFSPNVFVLNSTNIIVVYGDDTNSTGNAIGGVVNGNSIVFDTRKAIFNNVDTDYIDIAKISSTKFVVVFRDIGGVGDNGISLVGTP